MAISEAELEGAKTERPGSAREFLSFATGFWRQSSSSRAWVLTGLALALLLANLAVALGLNKWNRWFFDALERKDGSVLMPAIGVFVGLIVAGAIFAVAMTKVRMTLQVRWRQWLTEQLAGRWLGEQSYYRLAISGDIDSPEYRIADDVRLASEPVVDFALGFINALLSAIAFIGILFVVGGALTIPIWGVDVTIPGYIAIAAFAYAAIMTSVSLAVGQPLVACVAAKNESEAQLRYEMTRVRENAESIALIRGDDDERDRLFETLKGVVTRWYAVIRQHCKLTAIQNSNAFFAPVLPTLLAAPKYFSGELSLGAVVQLAAAFTAVLGALNWFVDNSIRLAEWSASARRVDELDEALEDLSNDSLEPGIRSIAVAESDDSSLHLRELSVTQRGGRTVIDDASVSISPGERVLLGGDSGAGKSTLIRAIAGLWPWGSGEILLPKDARLAFVPQRPYIPLGTLRSAIAYPDDPETFDFDTFTDAMEQAGLVLFAGRLDEEEDWSQIMSGGERQRVAFARLFLQKPSIIIMDEATAALDVDSEYRVLNNLFSRFPDAIIISIGHREGLVALHPRHIHLKRHDTGGRLIAGRRGQSKKTGIWNPFRLRKIVPETETQPLK